MKIRNKKELKSIRTKLRQSMPAPEVILWQKIRNKSLGVKFRRQFSINNYILDFYSPASHLALEIDGDSHYSDQKARLQDQIRDMALKKIGIRVFRLTNYEVMTNLEGVLQKLSQELGNSTPS